MALVRSDPFRDVDRLLQHSWGQTASGSSSVSVPLDAYRKGDAFVVHLDLPGVDPESIEVTVEDNVLAVAAQRSCPWRVDGVEALVAERAFGTFARQFVLGDNLDTEHIEASYERGVLVLTIPVAPRAKARRIAVTSRSSQPVGATEANSQARG